VIAAPVACNCTGWRTIPIELKTPPMRCKHSARAVLFTMKQVGCQRAEIQKRPACKKGGALRFIKYDIGPEVKLFFCLFSRGGRLVFGRSRFCFFYCFFCAGGWDLFAGYGGGCGLL